MEAKVRCLTRQVGCLRDELRRETKRTTWALKKSKDQEQRACALETRTNELLFINSKLTTELAAAEEAQKAHGTLKETEISTLRDSLSSKEHEWRKKNAYCAGQLAVVAAQLMYIENTITNNRIDIATRTEFGIEQVLEIEKQCTKAIKSTLHLNSILTADPAASKTASCSTNAKPASVEGSNAIISKNDGNSEQDPDPKLIPDNQQRALMAYRRCIAKLRAQVACSERRIKDTINKNTALTEELQKLKKTADRREKEHEALVEQLQLTNNALSKSADKQREGSESRQKKLALVEQENAELAAKIEKLKKIVADQCVTIKSSKESLQKHRRDISSALTLFHSSSNRPTNHVPVLVTTQESPRLKDEISYENDVLNQVHKDSHSFHEVDREIAELDQMFNTVKLSVL